jgi:regulatory protein
MSESTLFKTALRRSMAECSRRELCISEVRTKLQSWGIKDAEEDKIINILIEEKFINESRYATAFVKDKFSYYKWGRIKISMHLNAKNIPGDIIRKAIDIIDSDVYKKTLIDLLSARRRSVKAKNQYDLKAKLLRYGLSKGFESSLLYDILNEISDCP